jgi:hypothetical protein
MSSLDTKQLEEQLAELSKTHQALDDAISQLQNSVSIDQIKITRLKKEKLLLKEQVERIKSILIPNQEA